jgi:hypothetical protein
MITLNIQNGANPNSRHSSGINRSQLAHRSQTSVPSPGGLCGLDV